MPDVHKLRISEVLQEIETRRTYVTSEVARRRLYLRAVPDCRDRRQVEHEITRHAAVALELESLENSILGRAEAE
jgi:hypothetical protein